MASCPAAYMEIQSLEVFTTFQSWIKTEINGKVMVYFTADIEDLLHPRHTVHCQHSTSVERELKQLKLRRRNRCKEASRTDLRHIRQ